MADLPLAARNPRRRSALARCLMVQGTASGVGKSVIVTALCRVLAELGISVAPFKAQNMSLNAAATIDGGEIGRAQAAQAEAAGLQPRVTMNPVLLKPESDTSSQVVVLGKATGARATSDHWRRPSTLWPVIRSSLRELRSEFDVLVIEGAGSPAELNLRRRDVVNMRVAREAGAAVILVGDIDRGGVFAQLLGTLDLLSPADRRRVRALIVNKFRGDRSLFDDGVRILRERSGLPVFVLPYVDDIGVPSEDALAPTGRASGPDAPEIAVIVYPHVSNHDDLEPLGAAGARLRYVRRASDLTAPALIVLPGSKTTMADLAWMRARRIDERIVSLARAGTPVLGICGGFQMLGSELSDRLGVEGPRSAMPGLGLLPVRTSFQRTKRTVRVRGRVRTPGFITRAAGLSFEAYEIHLGVTERRGCAAFAQLSPIGSSRRVLDGAVSPDGRVVGTYAHGLFTDKGMRTALLASLAGERFVARPLPEDPYARVGEWLRSEIDVAGLLARCGIETPLG